MRTIFNFLGPLTNPAGATRQLLGVSDRRYQETIAEALGGLGGVHALVVAGEDGLDELSTQRQEPGDRGPRRPHLGVVRRAGRTRSRAGRARRGSPAASRPRTPARRSGSSREHGPAAGSRRSQRRRCDLRGRRSRRPRGRDGPGERGDRLRGGEGRPRPPRRDEPRVWLAFATDEQAGSASRRHPRGRRAPPQRAAGGGPAGASRHPQRFAPVQGGAGPAGAVADRRVQTRLALRRADPSRRRCRGDRQLLRARRRGGALRPHRGALLRRLASPTSRRPARPPTCRSSARTSSSIRTSCGSPRWPAPTRSC